MTDAIVHIVDDEEAVRDSIAMLLKSAGLKSREYLDAQTFLATFEPGHAGCVILDIRMPRMTGLELQQELNRRGWSVPVVFITGHGDVPMAVEAMREGAIDFLQKPFNDEEIIQRVLKALEHDSRLRQQYGDLDTIAQRLKTLTPREHEIAERIVAGQANKVIALDLAISERTVELHRARVMQKMDVRGVAQLVRSWIQLQSANGEENPGG